MSHAMLFGHREKGGRGKRSGRPEGLAITKGHWFDLVSNARADRRDITTSQRAMSHAMLFPKARRTGRGNKVSGRPDTLSLGHWQNLVSNARAVRDYSLELA
jgi:hypothetical protein